eukprot:TRINITY_DN15884_c0_g1_i2.p1 TRINITY_DN15884_c0_g1~~TRINITY_DN15884_c0_g1_i2.p1  ORF type:complete len:179 (+),score=32.94 TRINITY_DN15884_c0_g1_i2:39-575(+)
MSLQFGVSVVCVINQSLFFFFSSRRRHTRSCLVSWARRCVQETVSTQSTWGNLWKNCGKNPLYPQGGTWVYDRGYWCPGDLQDPDIFDVRLNQGKHSVDIVMEPYVATQNIQANENITAYLFQYTKPLKTNDVSLEDIIAPSCLLYTSDAADDMQCVDLGGRRIIKKKNKRQIEIEEI